METATARCFVWVLLWWCGDNNMEIDEFLESATWLMTDV